MSLHSPLFQAHSSLTGQSVRVYLKDLTFKTGVLFCIDPENGNVALLTGSSNDKAQVSVAMIMGHQVERIEQDKGATDTLDEMLRIGCTDTCGDDDATVETRSEQLEHLALFLAQRSIPYEKVQADEQISRADNSITQEARLSVFGGAATLAIGRDARPVVACANEQILQRLQTLMERFEASV